MKRVRFRQPCFVSLPDSSRNYAPGDCDTFDDEIAARVIASGRAMFVEEVEAPPPKPIDPDGPMVWVEVIPPPPGVPARLIDNETYVGGERAHVCEREWAELHVARHARLVEGQRVTPQAERFAEALADPSYPMRMGKYPRYEDFR